VPLKVSWILGEVRCSRWTGLVESLISKARFLLREAPFQQNTQRRIGSCCEICCAFFLCLILSGIEGRSWRGLSLLRIKKVELERPLRQSIWPLASPPLIKPPY